MNKKIVLAGLLLLLPFCVLAAERPVSEAELSAYKELSQARADALKESLQKDIQAQTARIEAQDKLIGRQDQLLDNFSGRISDLLTFLTLFGLLAGLLGYFTVSSRAKKEAEAWMEKEGPKAIDAKLKELDSHIADTKKEISDKFDKLYADAAPLLAEQQKQVSASPKSADGSFLEKTSPPNSDAIVRLVEALKHKPEAEYGFEDWNVRAFDAYTNENLALAAEYWLQAARGGNARGIEIAQALVNAGLVLSQLKRGEEAIAVYTDVASRYGNAPEAVLREQVARALVNKGATLCQLKRSEEAIAVCDDVVSRYGNAPEAALRELVAQARNGKGFELLCRTKENWADEAARGNDLQVAATLFAQAESEIANKPMVWGNQAYSAFLLGQSEAARPLLKQALQQGGEKLHEGTLDDLAIHPVPPDAEFRILLEEVWAEVKPKA